VRTGSAIPTRFTAANDETLGVAGLWAPWKHPQTSLWEPSFTMILGAPAVTPLTQ